MAGARAMGGVRLLAGSLRGRAQRSGAARGARERRLRIESRRRRRRVGAVNQPRRKRRILCSRALESRHPRRRHRFTGRGRARTVQAAAATSGASRATPRRGSISSETRSCWRPTGDDQLHPHVDRRLEVQARAVDQISKYSSRIWMRGGALDAQARASAELRVRSLGGRDRRKTRSARRRRRPPPRTARYARRVPRRARREPEQPQPSRANAGSAQRRVKKPPAPSAALCAAAALGA